DLLSSGALKLEDDGDTATAKIRPHPSNRVFRVAVGVTGDPVGEDWNAFDERFQWFGQSPQQVASGDHLFVLAVDRWRSAVVGLYEAVSTRAVKLRGSPNPEPRPS